MYAPARIEYGRNSVVIILHFEINHIQTKCPDKVVFSSFFSYVEVNWASAFLMWVRKTLTFHINIMHFSGPNIFYDWTHTIFAVRISSTSIFLATHSNRIVFCVKLLEHISLDFFLKWRNSLLCDIYEYSID